MFSQEGINHSSRNTKTTLAGLEIDVDKRPFLLLTVFTVFTSKNYFVFYDLLEKKIPVKTKFLAGRVVKLQLPHLT